MTTAKHVSLPVTSILTLRDLRRIERVKWLLAKRRSSVIETSCGGSPTRRSLGRSAKRRSSKDAPPCLTSSMTAAAIGCRRALIVESTSLSADACQGAASEPVKARQRTSAINFFGCATAGL